MQSRLVSLLQEKSDHSLYLWSEASGVYMDAAELVKSQATTCRETMVIVILNGESGIRYRIFSYKLPSYRETLKRTSRFGRMSDLNRRDA